MKVESMGGRPDVGSLPARFRNYIETLEARARQQAAALEEGPADSRLVLRDSLEQRRVPDTQQARFLFGNHRWVEASLSDVFASGRGDGSAVQLSGSGSLVVQPNSSNVFYVQLRAR